MGQCDFGVDVWCLLFSCEEKQDLSMQIYEE